MESNTSSQQRYARRVTLAREKLRLLPFRRGWPQHAPSVWGGRRRRVASARLRAFFTQFALSRGASSSCARSRENHRSGVFSISASAEPNEAANATAWSCW